MEFEHGPDTPILLQRIQEWIERGDTNFPLTLSDLNIISFPQLPESVEKLYCHGSYDNIHPLTSLPTLPSSLKVLKCHYTNISSLPELPSSLMVLFCANTNISNLPEFPPNLVGLNCENINITSIPKLPSTLKYLTINKCKKLVDILEIPQTLVTFSCEDTNLYLLPELLDPWWMSCRECPNLFVQSIERESTESYIKRWQPIWEKMREIERRDETILRCKAVKEELMEKTWHPQRVFNWCFDEEEKLDLRMNE